MLSHIMQLADQIEKARGGRQTRVRMLLQAATDLPAASVTPMKGSRTGLRRTQRSSAPILLPYHPETSSKERYVGPRRKN